jgi:FtsH-binding integral membrane protein
VTAPGSPRGRRRADPKSAVLIAASIFLDVFNIFLLLLNPFSGSRD